MKTDYLDYFIGEVFDFAPFEQMFYFLFENDLLEQFYQYCDENCTDDGYDIWYDRVKELIKKNEEYQEALEMKQNGDPSKHAKMFQEIMDLKGR